jgi:nicotinic acid mononucleotide adenylyltransferase
MGNNGSRPTGSSSAPSKKLSDTLRTNYATAVSRINRDLTALPFAEYDEVVLFTGSFYGPHRDHVNMAQQVRDLLTTPSRRVLVVVMPSNEVWVAPKLAEFMVGDPARPPLVEIMQARLELAAVAFSTEDCRDIVVSDADYNNRDPLKADWDTPYVALLRAAKGKPVHFLAGSDSIKKVADAVGRTSDITGWSILLVKRDDKELDASAQLSLAKLNEEKRTRRLAIEQLTLAGLAELSSTELRRAIAQRREADWRAMLPAIVVPIYELLLLAPPTKTKRGSRRYIGDGLDVFTE